MRSKDKSAAVTGLEALLEPRFDPAIRTRGRGYFRDGLVEVVDFDGVEVSGLAYGSDVYDLAIKVGDDRGIEALCTCPAFHTRGPCKHLWAFILELDDLHRRALRTGGGALLRSSKDFYDAIAAMVIPESAVRGRTGRVEPWRQRIERIKALAGGAGEMGRADAAAGPGPGPAAEAEDRVFYTMDLERSLRSGDLVVETCTRRRLKNGGWSVPRKVRMHALRQAAAHDPADRKVLALLWGALGSADYGSYYGYYGNGDRFQVPRELHEHILPALCATGRLRIREEPRRGRDRGRDGGQDDGGAGEDVPVVWDAGGPWRFGLGFGSQGPDGACVLEGFLERGAERMPLSEPRILHAAGWFLAGDRAAALDDGGAFHWIVALRDEHVWAVPAHEVEDLVRSVLEAHPPERIDLPPPWERVDATPAPRLHILAAGGPGRSKGLLHCHLAFDYGERRVQASDGAAWVVDAGAPRVLRRNLEAERAAAHRLDTLGFARPPGGGPGFPDAVLAGERLPGAVRALQELGWVVQAEDGVFRRPGTFGLSVSSGIDWFELHGGAEFEGRRVALPALLRALASGEGFVRLGDGSLGVLPEEWLQRPEVLLALGEARDDHLRFGESQAWLLDALLEATAPGVAELDRRFADIRDQLRSLRGVAPRTEPAGFQGELRPYQRSGLGWLGFLDGAGLGGCLADDMGLGKTVQVLAHLVALYGSNGGGDGHGGGDARPPRPTLVVAPKSVVHNWVTEAARFAPGLRVREYAGKDRAEGLAALDGLHLLVASYGVVRRDIAALREVEFEYAILDEAQAIKNAQSATAKAARLLRARRRLAMSGTPVENRLTELWSLFEFLNPGMLGRSSAFERFLGAGNSLDDAGRKLLAAAVQPFVLRRTKEQVASDLPPKTEQTVWCEMGRRQRKLYDELREYYREQLARRIQEEGMGRSKIQVLEALLRLRQAACHPGLLDPAQAELGSAKFDALLLMLEDVVAGGHKALVFSQFTKLLGLLKPLLDERGIVYEYLDGRSRKRHEKVARFQEDPDCTLFLISLKAGGTGLNLTAADYVFLLDPWWNPAVEAQAIDRAHRIGQDKKVFACRLIASGTVEEKVLELQAEKKGLAEAVITADASFLASLRGEDLARLFA